MALHFQDGGAGYARFRPTYPAQIADDLAALCPDRDFAIDAGCGTGQFSKLLSGRFERVLAIDPSADQIANAKPEAGLEFVQASAERIPAPDGSAFLAAATQAAHWFDLPAFYGEVRRVCAEGAALALVGYGVPAMEGDVGARLHDFYWRDIHSYWPPERRHVETSYAELEFPFPPLDLPRRRIERRWRLDALLGYVRTWSASKAAERDGAGALLQAFESEMVELWGDAEAEREIVWPVFFRAGRVG